MKYSIITPAQNESKHISLAIESVIQQSLKPREWIIVDDRSSDDTWQLIKKASKQYKFIKPVRINGERKRSVGANVVNVFNAGYCELSKPIDFITKMDADIVLEPDYFAKILKLFLEDSQLGMASGKTYIRENNDWILERIPDTHVSGACKTYRYECFEKIEGLIPLLGWDILDCSKARMKGWKTRSYRNLPIYHLRRMGSAKGMLRGRIRTGRVMFIIRAHPLFVLGKSLYRSLEKPYFSGLIIIVGYLASFFTKPPRLEDMELAKFLRSEQLMRLKGNQFSKEEILPKKL